MQNPDTKTPVDDDGTNTCSSCWKEIKCKDSHVDEYGDDYCFECWEEKLEEEAFNNE